MNEQPHIPLFELYDIWYTPLLSRVWVRVALGIVIIAVVCAIITILYRLCKRRTPFNSYQQAMTSMRALDPLFFHAAHDSDAFYVRITSALKEYCKARFHFAAGMTDEEFIRALERLPITDDLRAASEQIMTGAQYSKFAQQNAALERMKDDLGRSCTIIDSLEQLYKQQQKADDLSRSS
ncbi:MAG: DUF4381 family protein [Candidatus Babeliales bacterium]